MDSIIIPTSFKHHVSTTLLSGDVTYYLRAIGVDREGHHVWCMYRHGGEYSPGVPTRLYCRPGFGPIEKSELPSGIKWLSVDINRVFEKPPTTEEIDEVSEIETEEETNV